VPDQAGGFTGRVSVRAAGATTFRFSWVHGPVGGGHPEIHINVPVTITGVGQI
jgi:hypothetical protein